MVGRRRWMTSYSSWKGNMKDRQEVLERFRELRDRYLKERKEQFLGRLPINCVHNIHLRVKGKGQLGFCQNSLVLKKCGPHKMFLCNEADTANRCGVFCCRNTEASAEQEFKEILSSPSRCGNDYPKLAMLIWFLQDYDVQSRATRFSQMVCRAAGAIWGIISFRWW